MKHILAMSMVPREQLLPLARLAEEAGFEGVQIADHLAIPHRYTSVYPMRKPSWPPEKLAPFDLDAPWLDNWVLAGAIGAATTRLRFYSGVYVLPLRHAFVTAKAVATAALLSGGRVVLGVGAGWLKEEFDLVGQEFSTRGARMNEDIEVLRALWSGTAEYHGRFYDFDAVEMRPALPAPVPIYTGGESPAALRRAAELADGYLAFPHRTATYAEMIRRITELRAAAGRADREFEFIAMPPLTRTPEDFRDLAEAGAHGAIVRPWPEAENGGPVADKQRAIEGYATAIIEKTLPPDPGPR